MSRSRPSLALIGMVIVLGIGLGILFLGDSEGDAQDRGPITLREAKRAFGLTMRGTPEQACSNLSDRFLEDSYGSVGSKGIARCVTEARRKGSNKVRFKGLVASDETRARVKAETFNGEDTFFLSYVRVGDRLLLDGINET